MGRDRTAPLGDIEERIVGVHDGDSITFLTADEEQVKIRLEEIDAPELKQAFGTKSKQALSALVLASRLPLRTTGIPPHTQALMRVLGGCGARGAEGNA